MSAKSDAETEQIGMGVAAGVAVLAALVATVASAGIAAAPAVAGAAGAVGAAVATGTQAYQAGKTIDTASKANDYKKQAPLPTQTKPEASSNDLMGGNTPLQSNMSNQSESIYNKFGNSPGQSPISQIGSSYMQPAKSPVTSATPGIAAPGIVAAPANPVINDDMVRISGKMDSDMAANQQDKQNLKQGLSAAQGSLSNAAANLSNFQVKGIAPGAAMNMGGGNLPNATPNLTGNPFNANAMPIMNAAPPPMAFGQAPMMLQAPGSPGVPPMAFSDINVKTNIKAGRDEMNQILNSIYKKLVK